MKLIIDIPDDYVEEFKMQQKLLGDELSDVIDSRYSMARYSIANGIPLEDIKEEITQIANEEEKEDSKQWCSGLKYALKIIDKHIKENKQ